MDDVLTAAYLIPSPPWRDRLRTVGRVFALSIDRCVEVLLVTSLLAELAVVIANVVARTFFSYSFAWSLEVAEYALVFIAFVGSPIAYLRGEHMAFTLVFDRVGARGKDRLMAFRHLLVAEISVIVGFSAITFLHQTAVQRTSILNLPVSWGEAPMVLGFFLTAFYALRLAVRQSPRALAESAAVLAVITGILWLKHDALVAALFGSQTALHLELGVLVVLLLLGTPLAFVLLIASTIYIYVTGAPMVVMAITTHGGTTSFLLLAVPFFILAGFVMTHGGVSQSLFALARLLVGRVPGGLLHVVIVMTFLFSGLSGAKVADIAAVGSSMRDAVRRDPRIPPGEFAALLAAAAAAGDTVPPSVPMLVFASLASLSVGSLFIAGILPAVVLTIALMGLTFVRAIIRSRRGASSQQRGDYRPEEDDDLPSQEEPRTVPRIVFMALPALLMPLILLIGISSGVTTPTEVSAAAVVYGLILSMVLYRSFTPRTMWSVAVASSTLAGMVLFIVAAASTFSYTLNTSNVPSMVGAWVTRVAGGHAWALILLTIPLLLVTGALLEGLPAILIFVPILMPAALEIGIDPYRFAIIMMIAQGVGAFSPPLGIGYFVACSVSGTPLGIAARRGWPYVLTLVLTLVVIAFIPQLIIK